jgi:hypothetical protein
MGIEPTGSEQHLQVSCGYCGQRTEVFELPGRAGKYCLSCSADVAITTQLAAEIDAATLAGKETAALVAEFEELSERLLARAQSS